MRPFRIDVPQTALDDLTARLARTRWPDELPGVGWSYGVPLADVRSVAAYWRTTYDWRAAEAELNALPQFTTEIDGANVYFVHVRAADPDALPLLLTHGWPGSVVEFLDLIPWLAGEFHLVIPAIPGFGFSGPTRETGWNQARVARAWAELMSRLGYERYGAQGGDFGAGISRRLALLAPDRVAGVHLNYLPTFPPADRELTADEAALRAAQERWTAEQGGYAQIQGSRPQTLAYALADSPTGQLAWIMEKFHEWTDPASTIPRDRLLTNVMHYWLTNTAGSAARFYKESAAAGRSMAPLEVPVGVAVLPYEITKPLPSLADEALPNIIRWTELDRGGHFAAMEVPELLAEDVREFFRQVRDA